MHSPLPFSSDYSAPPFQPFPNREPRAEDGQSVLAACAGHRNDSGIRRKVLASGCSSKDQVGFRHLYF